MFPNTMNPLASITRPRIECGCRARQMTKHRKTAAKKFMALAALLVGAAAPLAPVSATTLTLDSVTLVGPVYEFSYTATLSGDEGLEPGSRFVIFDFGNYVPGSVSSGIYTADLAASTELTTLGIVLASGAIDDPLIPNLVFTWIGAPFDASGGPWSDVTFAGLTAQSTMPGVVLGSFSTVTVNNNGFATGTPTTTQGFLGVPAQSASSVPEPMTWSLMLLGFVGIGLAMRRQPQPTLRQIA